VNPLEAAVVATRSHGIRVDEPDVPQFVEDARARIERDRTSKTRALLRRNGTRRSGAAGYAREM